MLRIWKWFWRPSRSLGLGVILIMGVFGGVLFWGGFHTAMEASNSMAFCISCHEMRDNVYQEYKETVHYQNASGVRATCADCHVPHEWAPKVVRKIKATGELWGSFTGKIDTKEKFEAHRAEMAKRVWAQMEANDSRECRNCHAYEAMAFHEQSKDASEQMREGWEAGETCIACHKGIAHELPDLSSGYKKMYNEIEALAARGNAEAETVYSIRTEPVYLDAAALSEGGRPAGKALPATELKVIERQGDALKVRLEGWQQDGVDRVIYALMGRRIFSVALSPDATDTIERHETRLDEDTELTWHRVSMDLWIGKDAVIADEQKLWAYGGEMYNASCSVCHSVSGPGSHLANQWIGVLKSMERFIVLDKEQTRFLQKYLQFHAADVASAGNGAEASDG